MPNLPEFDFFYEKILRFYNTYSLKGLSEATGIPITTISSIKQRNSISALKKKCMELNIYDKIFAQDEEFYKNHTFISGKYYPDEEVKKLRASLGDFNFSEIDKIKKECEKWNIHVSTIQSKKILNLFETLYRDCEFNNDLENLEEDIKKLILKYNPKIDKKTEDKFLEFIDKESEK